jgi:DNA gyrase subunit A
MDMKDGDYIEHLFVTSSHDYLLFFSNRGKIYRSKVYELPEASRTAKGRALVNVLPLRDGERIQSVLSTRDFTEGKYLVFATRRGVVKMTEVQAFNTPFKADGIIAITQTGYIKSLPLTTYRQQHRGGVGVTGMEMKDGDYIEHLFVSSSHDFLLFFSNRGKVYRSKVYELPEMGRTARGRALVNVLPLREGERIQSVLSTRDFTESKYLVFATRKGTIKKTEFLAYNTPIKADGIIAINIRDDDELVAVRRVDPGDEILMISKEGLAVRFSEADARSMGRDTSGVRGMTIEGKNEVLAMDVARDEQEVLVVTENGFGKRTSVDEYRKTSRGAKGVQTIKFSEKRGGLAAALVVRQHQELVFISQEGMVQRTGVRGIRQTGRAAQGVTVMNVRDDDRVSAVALVVESDSSTAAVVESDVALEDGPIDLSADPVPPAPIADVPTEGGDAPGDAEDS